jgi:hypothetical protein
MRLSVAAGHHTESSSQATIRASYGLLKADVDMPLRSSKVLLVWTGTACWADMTLARRLAVGQHYAGGLVLRFL